MAVPELRQVVTKKLAEQVPDATVMHSLASSLKAYVIGKVNTPGQFPISLDTSARQILAMAGGLNPFAAADKILMIRRQEEGNF